MLARPYQERLVAKAKAALADYGNTLAVAPTGSGKTLMLSWLAKGLAPSKTLILQHRDELVAQNAQKCRTVWPVETTLYNADQKDWTGRVVFGMVQTLSREPNLASMPPLDMLIVDEAHHITAPTYLRIYERARELNPDCLVAGFTATPVRGDGRGLKKVFTNCCDQITLRQLVDLGFLVRPRTFIRTLPGVKDALDNVRKTAGGEYDLDEAAAILDSKTQNDTVVREWERIAKDRKTIVFCSTVKHAENVSRSFQDAGYDAVWISGDTPAGERMDLLTRFDQGDLQIICNCAVLTEGYDSQPVSCIVLLRPCSYKSTMLQMIGRGLRIIDPEIYPGVVKSDCIVLDFGNSLATHGTMEQAVSLEDRKRACRECKALIAAFSEECPVCGAAPPFEKIERQERQEQTDEDGNVISNVDMLEVNIFDASPFRWVDLFGSGKVQISCGFNAWAAIVSADGQTFHAVGKIRDDRTLHRLAVTDRTVAAAAADDFLRKHETDDTAKKNKRWLRDPASEKQVELLKRCGYNPNPLGLDFTKYSATAHLTFQWNRNAIERLLFQ
jgi:superfamily II DNA or RNA helicase